MRRLLTGALAAVLPALLVGALTIGCSSGDKGNTGDHKDNTGKNEAKGKKTELESKGWGTLKGRVTLTGDEPNIKALNESITTQIKANTQAAGFCLSNDVPESQRLEQAWVLGKDKGVGNVFVWLEPVDKQHYFKIDWDKKPWPKEVDIDQPHCAFVPHARVLFPGAFEDGDPQKTLKESGEYVVIKNSAPIDHNTHLDGGEVNGSKNLLMPHGAKPLEIKNLVPSSVPVRLSCDIHKWMTGVVRVYDHPYAAVTDKDGNFEIKNAPAGAEVRVLVWHELDESNAGTEVDKVKLEDGKTTEGKTYNIKAK